MEEKSLTLSEQIRTPKVITDFGQVLGSNEKANQFLAGVMALSQSNTDFSKCSNESIIAGAFQAASLNLDLTPGLGYAALIPYGNKAQFQVMTNGLVQLFQRSDKAKSINPFVVYKDEYNGMNIITGELLPLNNPIDGDRAHNKDENIVGYGCYMELTNGFKKTEFWTKEKVLSHAKKFSKTFSNGPWSTNFNAMALKTVTKYLLNHFAPKDIVSLQSAINADQMVYKSINNGSYEDNPGMFENVYTEEEKAEREALLQDLQNLYAISESMLCSAKKVQNIDDVPTEYIKRVFDKKNKEQQA